MRVILVEFIKPIRMPATAATETVLNLRTPVNAKKFSCELREDNWLVITHLQTGKRKLVSPANLAGVEEDLETRAAAPAPTVKAGPGRGHRTPEAAA